MLAWKIGKAAQIEDLSGTGMATFGGRWNHPDHPALYLSLSPAAGALELLLLAGETPHRSLKLMHLRLPDEPALYQETMPEHLPSGWNAFPADQPSMDFGTHWLERCEQLGLILPTMAMEQTRCLLINPLHPGARLIEVLGIGDVDPGRHCIANNG